MARKGFPDFRPVTPDDFPDADPKLFEILAPIQDALEKASKILQGKIGEQHLNKEILEKEIPPGVVATLALERLKGAPREIRLWVDVPAGSRLTEFGSRILDEKRLEVSYQISPATTRALPCRIIVEGA